MTPTIHTEATDPVLAELSKIAKDKGMLRPYDVVEYARDPGTALHSKFTWDDSRAAHAYRLYQARQVIRVSVKVLPEAHRETRAFVSLSTDRVNPGGGYRPMVEVLSDEQMRERLLADARAELRTFRKKYDELRELAPVFSVVDDFLAQEAAS